MNNKKKKHTIRFLLLFLVVFLIIYEYYVRIKLRHEIDKGLKLVQKENGMIILGAGNIYSLNTQKGTWDVIMSGSIAGIFPQTIAIKGKTIVYHDGNDYQTKISKLNNPENIQMVSELNSASPPFELSNDNNKLAYIDGGEVCIYDLVKKRKTSCGITRVKTLSWSCDDMYLFFTIKDGIWRYDCAKNEKEYITQGYWVKALPNNTLGYWRGDGRYEVCFKTNLNDMTERELFRTEQYLLGSDWDPKGRYVVAVASSGVHGFLFIPRFVGLPLIWDTDTGKMYRLPETTDFKTGCVFWVER